MHSVIILLPLLISFPISVIGQNPNTFEIEADKVDSNSNVELQIFYKKFNLWVSTGMETITLERDEAYRVNNFVIFSEDGLIMKDFDFHSVESCKELILKDYPKIEAKNIDKVWMFISLESQVNREELISILEFLSSHNIDYVFGNEDDFVPGFKKK